MLVESLRSGSVESQLSSISILGNLLTDVFDPEARLSLKLFVEAGGLAELQTKLAAEFPINLFAAAALQNATSIDPRETCTALRDAGCEAILTAMMSTDDEQMKQYVTGVIANLRAFDPNRTNDVRA